MSKLAQMEMQERKDAKFIQFAAGDYVDGILVALERVKIDGQNVIRYTVQDEGGELFSFLGTYQLNTKLRPSDLGHRVVVRCSGEDKNIGRDKGNAMKTFQVAVSKEPVKGYAGLTITDDDLPKGI